MKFFGNVLSTIVGIFLFFMISFFMLILLSTLFSGDSDAVQVEDNSVLVFDMENVTNDYGGQYTDPLISMFSQAESIGVTDILNAISAAKDDDNIKGISILNDNTRTGIAQTKALRDALIDFKKSGKFVVAYSNAYSQKEYYLNSVADTIYLNPEGEFDFKGLATEVMYFKDFQEKSGITMEVIRHGKYKSAVEPFLDNKMSEANRAQLTALLTSVWGSIVTEISQSREIPVARLNEIANTLGARTPEMAKAQKLIDKIAYEDDYHNAIRKRLKVDKDEKYNKVQLLDYARNVATTPSNFAKDKIAIVYAQGQILSGEGDVNYIGDGAIRRAIQDARKDENVKAIVLRVDSPGGSALTSDLIWRELELAKKEKPVVVSMGNYAASGGYYIACNANTIFAENGTITGSIGVFGVLPNLTKLSNKVGINTVQVKTHDNASGYSPFVPLQDNYRQTMQNEIERIYSSFVTKVAKGRKMTVAQVDSIAQGRVWTGSEALKIGLVDKIGGLDDAIKEAAKLAKTSEYHTKDYPEYRKNLADALRELPLAQSKEKMIREELGPENYEILQAAKQMTQRKGIQAMLPVKIDIH